MCHIDGEYVELVRELYHTVDAALDRHALVKSTYSRLCVMIGVRDLLIEDDATGCEEGILYLIVLQSEIDRLTRRLALMN